MGLGKFKKEELSPAEKGFEAARHENSPEAIEARRKKLHEGLAEKVKIKDARKKELPKEEKIPDDTRAQILKLHVMIAEQNEKLQQLVESDKKVHEEISEEEHEFVESVETLQTGGNVMNDIIRFKDTDLIIVADYNGIGIYNNETDYENGIAPEEYFEKEEMEKIPLGEENEKTIVEDKDLNEYKDLSKMSAAERVNAVMEWYSEWLDMLDGEKPTERKASAWLDGIMKEQKGNLDQSDEAIIWDLIKKKL